MSESNKSDNSKGKSKTIKSSEEQNKVRRAAKARRRHTGGRAGVHRGETIFQGRRSDRIQRVKDGLEKHVEMLDGHTCFTTPEPNQWEQDFTEGLLSAYLNVTAEEKKKYKTFFDAAVAKVREDLEKTPGLNKTQKAMLRMNFKRAVGRLMQAMHDITLRDAFDALDDEVRSKLRGQLVLAR